jgi:hypothetical protein
MLPCQSFKLCLIAGVFCVWCGGICAEPKDPHEIMTAIRAAWEENQKNVRTIQCTARRESVYPKGGLTTSLAQVQNPKPVPERDLTFSDQSFRMWIDFERLRIRRETELVTPLFTIGSNHVPFERRVSIDLVVDGEYRTFRLRKDNPWIVGKNWNLMISPESFGFIEFDSLPVLWTAGCVSAKSRALKAIKQIDDPGGLTLRGKAVRNGIDCYVIIAQEGEVPGYANREYWVQAKSPYPIVFCTVRARKGIPWQLEVSYSEQGTWLVPATITYTQFNYPSTNVGQRISYRFDEFLINSELGEKLFQQSLEPGMIVNYPGKEGIYEVNRNGQIVPYGEKGSSRKVLVRVILILIALGVVGLLARHYLLRKRTTQP